MSTETKRLFNREGLSHYLDRYTSKVRYAVSVLDIGQVSTIVDNVAGFIKKYDIIVPKLLEGEGTRHSRPVIIEDSSRFDYPISDKTRFDSMNGIRHTIEVPFTGDQNLFLFSPSSWGFEFAPPSGLIKGDVLILQFDDVEHNKDKIDQEIKNTLDKVNKFLDFIQQDVDRFKKRLLDETQKYVQDRYEELRLNSGLSDDTDIGRQRPRGGRGLDL